MRSNTWDYSTHLYYGYISYIVDGEVYCLAVFIVSPVIVFPTSAAVPQAAVGLLMLLYMQ